MSGEHGSLIKHLSWLSRINVSEEEADELKQRIEAVKRLIDRLLEARVEDVEPLYHPHDKQGLVRPDTPEESLRQEDALLNPAKTENGFIVGPRTVED